MEFRKIQTCKEMYKFLKESQEKKNKQQNEANKTVQNLKKKQAIKERQCEGRGNFGNKNSKYENRNHR